MKFGEAIKSYFYKYATFGGRAGRSEFWFAALFTFLVSTAAGIINPGHLDANGFQQSGTLQNLWSFATIVPNLAIGFRRLHDTNRSGVNLLWALLPLVGWIILIVRLAKDSEPGANQYGEPVK